MLNIKRMRWTDHLKSPVAARLVIAVLLGCLISYELFALVRSLDLQEKESDLGSRADNLLTSLRRSIDGDLDELRALRAFNASGGEMTRQEFAAFVSDSLYRHPELGGFSWNPRVSGDQRPQYEAEARAQGYADFRFTEWDTTGQLVAAPDRIEYVIVYYVEPLNGNETALGFNVASDPLRKKAMDLARDTGQMAATAPIYLVQTDNQTNSVLVFYPIFGHGSSMSTVIDRRTNLLGFVVGILPIPNIFEYTLRGVNREGIGISLSDTTDISSPRNLYSDGTVPPDTRPFESERLDVAGRQWYLQLFLLESAIAETSSIAPLAWVALSAGLLFTALVSGFIFASGRHAAEMERATSALRESEHRFRSVAQTAGDAIVSLNSQGRVVFWNRAAESIFGYTSEEAMGKTLDIIIPERLRPVHASAVQGSSASFEPDRLGKTIELTARRKDGVEFPIERSLSMWRTDSEVFFTGILRDITDRKQVERRLRFLSSHDVLTGLYNRGFFEEELTRLQGGREYPLGVVMIDLDELKKVNDTLGHSAGDKLIRHAAVLLAESFRSEDIVARIGGDEFAVLLPGADEAMLQEIIRRLKDQAEIRNQAFPDFPLQFSLGAVVVHGGDELSDGLKIADERMYAAKQKDRGRTNPGN